MVRCDEVTSIVGRTGGKGLWLILSRNEIVETGSHVKDHWLASPPDDGLIIFLNASDRESFGEDAIATLRRADRGRPQFYLLLARSTPPEIGARVDEEVFSYACSLSVYRSICGFYHHSASFSAYQAAYAVLYQHGAQVEFRCFQFPDPVTALESCSDQSATCEWIIPHKGSIEHLCACLDSVSVAATDQDVASLCFDEEITERHFYVISQFPHFQYFRSHPSGNGPYVSRERLCQASKADYMIFQDSDDVSCFDRRALLLHNMTVRELDWVGCHELRVDEMSEKVIAVRFPYDVMRALDTRLGHPLLFPTSMIRRSALLRAGGFSTHRQFGSDTEFLLRAFIHRLKIGNVDEFLYIRRKRLNSLTTAPESALDSPIRQALDRSWKEAFVAVKSGQLALRDSALQQAHDPDYWRIEIEMMHPTQPAKLRGS